MNYLDGLDLFPSASTARIVLAGFDLSGRRALLGVAGDAVDLVNAADAEALHRALREPVDAVICDARLDPGAALAALSNVRQRDWALPTLVLVSRLDSETAAEAHRVGATMILRAPFTPEDVLDAVASMRE